jgi:hypothetical protein
MTRLFLILSLLHLCSCYVNLNGDEESLKNQVSDQDSPPTGESQQSIYFQETELIVHPPQTKTVGGESMLSPTVIPQWQEVYKDYDTLGLFIGKVKEMVESQDSFLFDLKQEVSMTGKGVQWETAGVVPLECPYDPSSQKNKLLPGLGLKSAQALSNQLNGYKNLIGKPVTSLAIDGPFKRVLEPYMPVENCEAYTWEQAVDEFLDFVIYLRDNNPETKLRLLFNLPNWSWVLSDGRLQNPYHGPSQLSYGSGQDLKRVLLRLFNKLKNLDHTIDAIIVDNPFNYLKGEVSSQWAFASQENWERRMDELKAFTESEALKFGVIFNSQVSVEPFPGSTLMAQRFQENSLAFLIWYQNRYGRNADIAIVESWYPSPDFLVPESAQYSFMNTAKLFSEQLALGAQCRGLISKEGECIESLKLKKINLFDENQVDSCPGDQVQFGLSPFSHTLICGEYSSSPQNNYVENFTLRTLASFKPSASIDCTDITVVTDSLQQSCPKDQVVEEVLIDNFLVKNESGYENVCYRSAVCVRRSLQAPSDTLKARILANGRLGHPDPSYSFEEGDQKYNQSCSNNEKLSGSLLEPSLQSQPEYEEINPWAFISKSSLCLSGLTQGKE